MTDTYSQQPLPSTPHLGPPQATQTGGGNGLATAGFVLALLGLLGSWIPFLNILGIILAVLGVVLAGVGLARSRRTGTGKGLAIAGLILGALALLVAVIINVAFVGAVGSAVDDATKTTVDAGNGATSSQGSDREGLGATRDNPAPIGSKITADDWVVTINSVTTADQDSIGQKPKAGATLLVVNMKASYNGDNEQGETPWATVNFVTADGTTIDGLDDSTIFLPENQFNSLKTVYSGASVKGDLMLEVPADTWKNGVLAVSPGVISDDTFVSVK